MENSTQQKSGSRYLSRDTILGLAIVAFAVLLALYLIPSQVPNPDVSGTFITPAFFPYAITAAMALLGLATAYNGAQTSTHTTRAEEKAISSATLIWISVAGIAIASIGWIGLAPAAFIIMFASMRLYGYPSTLSALLISLVFTLVLFLFFEKLAGVSIPRGFFEDWY